MKDLVPVAPLREAFEERPHLTAGDIARNLGWWRKRSGWEVASPDITRVKRTLGIAPYRSNGRTLVRTQIQYHRAVELAEAMNVDPVEVGI